MRLKPLDEEVRIFLAPHEYQKLLKHSPRRTRLAEKISARTSPRIGIVAKLRRKDFYVPEDEDVELAFVKLRETKDTTEGDNPLGGKYRISWVPWSLYDEVEEYCETEGIGPEEQIFDVKKARLRDLIKAAAEDTATATDKDEFKHLTPHDLRAYYATNMVRRMNVNVETVMEMGGWDSREAIKPYLAAPLARDLQNDLARAGVTEKNVPIPPAEDKADRILHRLDRIEKALELDSVVDDVNDLTASEVQSLKEIAKEKDGESTSQDNRKTSLNQFNAVVHLPVILSYGLARVTGASLSRLDAELDSIMHDDAALGSARRTALSLFGVLSMMVITGILFASTGVTVDPISGEVTGTPLSGTALLIGSIVGATKLLWTNRRLRIDTV